VSVIVVHKQFYRIGNTCAVASIFRSLRTVDFNQ
jgi:hypothetical protein